MRNTLLRDAHFVLAAIDEMHPASNFCQDILKREVSHLLTRPLLHDGLQGLLEGQVYCTLDMFFFFLSTFLRRRFIIEDFCRFGALSDSDVFPLDHHSVQLKTLNGESSKRM